jgi:fatty acid/phospholipid biosynthesis enzyme
MIRIAVDAMGGDFIHRIEREIAAAWVSHH